MSSTFRELTGEDQCMDNEMSDHVVSTGKEYLTSGAMMRSLPAGKGGQK